MLAYRSLARLKLSDVPGALQDADRAIAAAPGWEKPWYRRYAALAAQGGRQEEALHALACAQACEEAAECGKLLISAVTAAVLDDASAHQQTVHAKVAAAAGSEPQTIGGRLRAMVMKRVALGPSAAAAEAALEITAAETATGRSIQKADLDRVLEELECVLCCNTLCRPAALPCGHVLCRNCLARCASAGGTAGGGTAADGTAAGGAAGGGVSAGLEQAVGPFV